MNARTVIDSNGRPRRMVLTQPPGYRTGTDARPAVDHAALDAVRALRRSDSERNAHHYTTGTRPVTTR